MAARMQLSLHPFEWCDLWDELSKQSGWGTVQDRIVYEVNQSDPNAEIITMHPFVETVKRMLNVIENSELQATILQQVENYEMTPQN